MFDSKATIAELKATGLLENIKELSIDLAYSGSCFFSAESTETSSPCFLKQYQKKHTKHAKAEKLYIEHFSNLLSKKNVQFICCAPIYHFIPLLDGSNVLVMKYIKGVTLSDLLSQNKKLSQTESESMRLAFLELANCLKDADFMHRDICPRNLMWANGKMHLFDFQTAIEYKPLFRKNPTLKDIRDDFELSGCNPAHGEWNDIFSIAKTYEMMTDILTLDQDQVKQDLDYLFSLSKTLVTLRTYYTVDAAWKQANKVNYYRLLLRPLWTLRPSRRKKRACVVTTLKGLYQSNPGEYFPKYDSRS